ncbi:MAG TPA: glycine--tRNA ligase subunit beta [Novosphingobium sp.]|nr:glycine--tRNA ligase subunit beta [Novosphingobium sp.]
MTDFLLELRCEEIPARMQAGARADLAKLFTKGMAAAGVSLGALTVWSTPRRLALIARDLPLATAAVSEELKGPRVGAPPQALEGFLRKTGLTGNQLTERGGILYAVTEKPGRATKDVLAEAIPALIRAFPWPKSQRWGAASLSTESLRWVRPLSGIVALFGDELVECEIGGVSSGCATLGHRFHHSGIVTIGGASDYSDKMRACHVIVDHAEREGLIREMSRAAALAAGLELVEDEGLVIENAGLTEWPVPLLGRFDAAFLEVPPEVIQLTARTNQKYFVCEESGGSGAGKLVNAFVCTANIAAHDGGAAIIDGNRKVLAARLSDARFFWEQDRKKTLAQHAEKLANIVFHEKLGTVADKVERVAKLAEWLATKGIVPNCDPALARQAAELCKADLVTEMVGEFPELQGLMGGYYARAEGLDPQVADAIRDHYKPVGQGDDVPTAPVTVAVSLADKLDTLVSFFSINEVPTGSKDPFALRRAAISAISILKSNQIRMDIVLVCFHAALRGAVDWKKPDPNTKKLEALATVVDAFDGQKLSEIAAVILKSIFPLEAKKPKFEEVEPPLMVAVALRNFFLDRLEVAEKTAGIRSDIIRASRIIDGARGIDGDLVRLLARVHALQAFVGTDDGANLLAGYKRAANILKKEDWHAEPTAIPRDGEEDPFAMVDDPDMAEIFAERIKQKNTLSYTPEPAEKALIDALDLAAPRAAAAVEAEDFAGAMAALASLRAPIDAFFEGVTVNDANPDIRAARLSLLASFRDAVHRVADFSKIEG